MKTFIQYFFVLLSSILLCLVVFEGSSMASLPGGVNTIPVRLYHEPQSRISNSRDLSKIIEILESKARNHQLSKKAIQKLTDMKDDDIRLVSSLCDRISDAGDAAGADLAFILVTALIVIS
jgi:hypothetical protein